MKVLFVNVAEEFGGAESVIRGLRNVFEARGCETALAAGRPVKSTNSFRIPDRIAALPASRIASAMKLESIAIRRIARALDNPIVTFKRQIGLEDFDFPGTYKLLRMAPFKPDVVHLHNLHGGYFDLRALSWLSQQVPTVVTLHDAWLLSGHCAHSFGCERWQTGCGRCPDLRIPMAIKRDATRWNWQRKRRIFAVSRLYVASPSCWLLNKVEASILRTACCELRHISNGVNHEVFFPGSRSDARRRLGIADNARVLVFVANPVVGNAFKDFASLDKAFAHVVGRRPGEEFVLIGLGDQAGTRTIGKSCIRFVPYVPDPQQVRAYYQAADLYVHPSLQDTFPTAVLEALACGLPIVATAVGGITEQVNGLGIPEVATRATTYGLDRATGVLVEPRDVSGLANAIDYLLRPENLMVRAQLAENAARDARRRFDVEQCAGEYLRWFETLTLKHPEAGGLNLRRERYYAGDKGVPASNDRAA